jgi:serine/threonine protein kinase
MTFILAVRMHHIHDITFIFFVGDFFLANVRVCVCVLFWQMIMSSDTCVESPSDEIRILRRLGSHPHLVRFVEARESGSVTWTVLEYCPGGELFDVVTNDGRLDEARCARYARQFASALAYCHARAIAHLDVSLENALLDAHDNVKLCDFGVARELKRPPTRENCPVSPSHSAMPTSRCLSASSSPPASGDGRLDAAPKDSSMTTDADSGSSSHVAPPIDRLVGTPTFERSTHSAPEPSLPRHVVTDAALYPSDVAMGLLSGKPGKITYMAPEVYAGGQFDGRRADMFSFGVMLFIMLIGVPPWRVPTTSGKIRRRCRRPLSCLRASRGHHSLRPFFWL